MSNQAITVTNSSYYYMGFMNILNLLQKRIIIIEEIFGVYFPDLETSWVTPWTDDISPILTNFGFSKIINNAMPDKPVTQGDGSLTPWSTNKSPANLQAMYYMLHDAGVTLNIGEPIDALLSLIQSDPSAYQLRSLRCNTILDAYESIHEIESTIYVIIYSIYTLYRVANTISKSPGQLMTISGDTINEPYLFDITGLGSVLVMWESIDIIMTALFSKTYFDKTILKTDISAVSHSNIINTGTIKYISGDDIYTVDISSVGKIAVACVNLKLEGIDGGDLPISYQLLVDYQGGLISDSNIGLDEDTIYLGKDHLTPFKDPSDVDYTIEIVYYET